MDIFQIFTTSLHMVMDGIWRNWGNQTIDVITLIEGLLQSWEFSSKNTTHTYQIAAVSATTLTYTHKVRSIKQGLLNLKKKKKNFKKWKLHVFFYILLCYTYTLITACNWCLDSFSIESLHAWIILGQLASLRHQWWNVLLRLNVSTMYCAWSLL